MMLILYPSIAKNFKFPKKSGGNDIKIVCYEVFRENSTTKRFQFFSQLFIQYLWTCYISESAASIGDYFISLLHIQEDGLTRYQMLLSDIVSTELKHSFKILPEAVR